MRPVGLVALLPVLIDGELAVWAVAVEAEEQIKNRVIAAIEKSVGLKWSGFD